MCKYCEIEDGSVRRIAGKNIEVSMGGRRLDDDLLALYMGSLKEGWVLDATYWPGYLDDMFSARITINYCPFCGRKLNTEKSRGV